MTRPRTPSRIPPIVPYVSLWDLCRVSYCSAMCCSNRIEEYMVYHSFGPAVRVLSKSDVIRAGWPRSSFQLGPWTGSPATRALLPLPLLSSSLLFYARLVQNATYGLPISNALCWPLWPHASSPTAFRPDLSVLQHPPDKRSFLPQTTLSIHIHVLKAFPYLLYGCETRCVQASTV